MSAVVAAVGMAMRPATIAWVTRATAFSRSAGPDGDGLRLDQGCGLGHALLRTSPGDGAQPVSLDGRTWLSADVRLDDRHALVTELRGRGQAVSAALPDAELVLHSYEAWGESCLDHLIGDFAFALWDGDRRRLLCGRDQIGVVPLHYAHVEDALLVATCIDALLLHPDVSDELDEAAVADFLLAGRSGDFESTVFEHIRRVPPAHALTWHDGRSELRRYWRLPDMEPLATFRRPEDYALRFRDLLDAAVADRLTSDCVSVHVSGGLDSTSVAAGAVATLATRGGAPEAVRAVTVDLGGTSGDEEGWYASLVAERLGVPIDVVDGASFGPEDPLARPPVVTPEPTPYRRTRLEYESTRLLAGHATVALSGLAGDALLGFTPWYWAEWLARGKVIRVGRALADPFRVFGKRPHPRLRTWLAHASSRRSSGRAEVPEWLAPAFGASIGAAERRPELVPRGSARDARSLVGNPLWSGLFTWGDASFTGLPLRFRHPLVDLRLLSFVRSLPPDPWLVDKRILREAARDRLPEEVRTRKKTALVAAAPPGHSPALVEQLIAMVKEAPGLDRFVDRAVLARGLATTDAANQPADRALALPVGLAHWLVHRVHPERNGYFSPAGEEPVR